MSCRSNPGNSAATSYARLQSNLSDMQTLSTFHALVREGRNQPDPTPDQVREWAEATRRRVQNNSNLSEAQRTRLLSRIDAAEQGSPPNGATFYAWNNIESATQRANSAILEQIASAIGSRDTQAYQTATARFTEFRNQSDADRNLVAPADFRASLDASAIPQDRGTLYGLYMLQNTQPSVSASPVTNTANNLTSVPVGLQPQFDAAVTTMTRNGYHVRHYYDNQWLIIDPNGVETSSNASALIEQAATLSLPNPTPVRQPIIREPVGYSGVLHSIGYDSSSGRLQVAFNSGSVYEYEGVPAEVYAEMRDAYSMGSFYSRNIRGQYNSTRLADGHVDPPLQTSDAVNSAQNRCPNCGQFIGEEAHQCTAEIPSSTEPAPLAANPYPANEEAVRRALRSASFGDVRQSVLNELRSSPLPFFSPPSRSYVNNIIQVNGATVNLMTPSLTSSRAFPADSFNMYVGAMVQDDSGSFRVEGYAQLNGLTEGRFATTSPNLRCNCPEFQNNGNCSHVGSVYSALTQYYGTRAVQRDNRAMRAARRVADRRAAAYFAQERQASEEAQARAQAERQTAETQESVSYSQNMASFQAAYNEAKARKRRGEAPIPYMTENATGGLGSRNGGRGFGVEIEFEFTNGTLSHTVQRQMLDEMAAAGLPVGGYDRANTNVWSLHADSSLSNGLELVTPILYDEPETWRQLKVATDIIQRYGGKATARTGGHVHVACDNYDHTPKNHTNLVRMYNAYQDDLFRLAQNTSTKVDRNRRWCATNSRPSRDYSSPTAPFSGGQSGNRYYAINFAGVRGSSTDHVEYRLWGGSVDPTEIQARIKLSLAMTEAAFRAESSETATLPTQTLGSHKRQTNGARELSGEAWEQNTQSFREMTDKLFTRPEDKAQMAALFAVTRWHNG